MNLQPLFLQKLREGLGLLLVGLGENLVHDLDDVNLGAETGHDGADLDADCAGSDDRQMLR